MFSLTGIEDGQREGWGAACQGRTATSSSNDQTKRTLTLIDNDEFFTDAEQKANPPIVLPEGKPKGFYIVDRYPIPDDGFDTEVARILDGTNDVVVATGTTTDEEEPTVVRRHGVTRDDLVRLNIDSGTNVTLPVALILLDPVEYPSFSRFDEKMGFTSVVSNPKAAFMAANGLVHGTGRKKKSGGAPVLVVVDTAMVGGCWGRRVV